MANTFDSEYGQTPWAAELDKNQQTVYVPELLDIFTRQSIFYKMVDYSVNLGAMHTGKVVFTQRIPPEINTSTLDNRGFWLPQLYLDSRQIEITCQSNGGKVQIHKYDNMITYWQQAGATGLIPIMRNELAPNMVATLDMLARNAFLDAAFYSFAGGATGFDNLAANDTFDIGEITRAVKLGAEYEVDIMNNPIFCITAPSALHTIKGSPASSEWVSRIQYAQPQQLINWEVGAYNDVRFSQSPMLTLWNCGEVLAQTTVAAAIAEGDGAPDPSTTKVDGVWQVGQEGATHYITVADASDLAVGDTVTLHRVRNATGDAKHVLNGVQWDHAYNLNFRITAISGNNVSFERPVMVDWYTTALSAGVYGYLTKARPVHAAIFIKGPRAVVAGVLQSPQTYILDPIDDKKALWRFTWDWYGKYQPFYTNRCEVYFFAGPIRANNVVVNL